MMPNNRATKETKRNHKAIHNPGTAPKYEGKSVVDASRARPQFQKKNRKPRSYNQIISSHNWLFTLLKKGKIPKLLTEDVPDEIAQAYEYLGRRQFNRHEKMGFVITCLGAFMILTACKKQNYHEYWDQEPNDDCHCLKSYFRLNKIGSTKVKIGGRKHEVVEELAKHALKAINWEYEKDQNYESCIRNIISVADLTLGFIRDKQCLTFEMMQSIASVKRWDLFNIEKFEDFEKIHNAVGYKGIFLMFDHYHYYEKSGQDIIVYDSRPEIGRAHV